MCYSGLGHTLVPRILILNKFLQSYNLNKYAAVMFLSIVFVYTLSINVLDVSQILVGSVIFGAKPDEMTLSKNIL